MTPQRFAQRVRNDLRARRWLRWHCSLIGLLTLLASWACSRTLMRLGSDALSLRYGASFAVASVVLMLLLYLWARWSLSRGEGDWLQIDGGGGSGGGGSGGGSRSGVEPPIPSGGGDRPLAAAAAGTAPAAHLR